MWRTPYSGTNKDLDHNFTYYSQGFKELYYLDAIVTPTHTAIFSKEVRSDGLSALRGNEYSTTQLKINDVFLFNNKDLSMTIDRSGIVEVIILIISLTL